VPKGRNVIYGSFVVDIKEHKEERERTMLTVGGDQIEFPDDKYGGIDYNKNPYQQHHINKRSKILSH
jgi:hypothetical protein